HLVDDFVIRLDVPVQILDDELRGFVRVHYVWSVFERLAENEVVLEHASVIVDEIADRFPDNIWIAPLLCLQKVVLGVRQLHHRNASSPSGVDCDDELLHDYLPFRVFGSGLNTSSKETFGSDGLSETAITLSGTNSSTSAGRPSPALSGTSSVSLSCAGMNSFQRSTRRSPP